MLKLKRKFRRLKVKGLKLLENTVRFAVANADFSFGQQSFQIQTILLAGGPVQLSRYSQSLRAGRLGDRIQVGASFRTCADRPWGPPSLLYIGFRVSFPGIKWPGRGPDHPPSSSAEVKDSVEL